MPTPFLAHLPRFSHVPYLIAYLIAFNLSHHTKYQRLNLLYAVNYSTESSFSNTHCSWKLTLPLVHFVLLLSIKAGQ
jgi:hypothetical protein